MKHARIIVLRARLLDLNAPHAQKVLSHIKINVLRFVPQDYTLMHEIIIDAPCVIRLAEAVKILPRMDVYLVRMDLN